MHKKTKKGGGRVGGLPTWITNLSPFIPLSEQTLLSPEEAEAARKKQHADIPANTFAGQARIEKEKKKEEEKRQAEQEPPDMVEVERTKKEAIAEVDKAHQQLIKDKTPEEITELEETRRQLLADIEAGLLDKELPPVYDPSGTFHRKVSHYAPYVYNVFRKADNASLSLLQKAAWYKKAKKRAGWPIVIGLFGEVAAYDYLKNDVMGNVANQSFVANVGRGKPIDAYKYAKQNTKFIQAPDRYTDIIMVADANKDVVFSHSFQRPRKDSFLGGNVIVDELKKYDRKTVFVYEVKTSSPTKKLPDIVKDIMRGFNQLNKSEHIIHNENSAPVLVLDRATWNASLRSSKKEEILEKAKKLETMGGGLMLISGMNKAAAKIQNDTLKYIRDNTDEVPQDYY